MILFSALKTVLKSIALLFIKAYQYIISPLTGPSCRFSPTCSCYAHEAIEKHGFLKGMFLFLRRFLKCHPWGDYGYDPVPEVFHWHHRKKTGKNLHNTDKKKKL